MRSLTTLLTATALTFAPLPRAIAQGAPVSTPPAVEVRGSPRPVTLTAAMLASLPRAQVTTVNNGIRTTYDGVWLSDVLTHAGVALGPALRGRALASYVLATAADGYQVLFSLGELDPAITDGRVLLADTADGRPLYGESGSFRLVIPGDKRGARAVRALSSLTLVTLEPPATR
jgi:hypothetical protein